MQTVTAHISRRCRPFVASAVLVPALALFTATASGQKVAGAQFTQTRVVAHRATVRPDVWLAGQALQPPAPGSCVPERPTQRAHGCQELPFRHRHLGPDGTAVYAVEAGQVFLHRGREAVAVKAARGNFGYWHVKPAVRDQQMVRLHQLLGHIVNEGGADHVHFAERRGNQYVNPLRPGGIGPYVDHTPPTVASVEFLRNGHELDAQSLTGRLNIVVEAFDTTPMLVPKPWSNLPVTPARIRWSVACNGRRVIATADCGGFPREDAAGQALRLDLRPRDQAELRFRPRPLPVLPRTRTRGLEPPGRALPAEDRVHRHARKPRRRASRNRQGCLAVSERLAGAEGAIGASIEPRPMTTYTHTSGITPRSIVWAAVALSTVVLSLSLGAARALGTGERSVSAGYQSPVKPFDRQHPVRGSFGDPTDGLQGVPDSSRRAHRWPGESSLHRGIDIVAPDGSLVYPVASGTVTHVDTRDHWVKVDSGGGRVFEYWHIHAMVSVGAHVEASRTVLGHIMRGSGHVHLTELENGAR